MTCTSNTPLYMGDNPENYVTLEIAQATASNIISSWDKRCWVWGESVMGGRQAKHKEHG